MMLRSKSAVARAATLAGALVLLAACASQPGPLRGDYTVVTPRQAAERDYTGAMVRWGGRIVRTQLLPDRTCFEMVTTRLDVHGRPYWADDDTRGRFIACRPGFYDPNLFTDRRDLTFTGRIDGYEMRNIAGLDYRFARLAADTVYLWPVRERSLVTRPAPWPWWGWW